MKIIFFGSSDYCLPVLESLYKNFKLQTVITRPDKPLGRKQIFTPSLPKKFALSHNVKVYTPKGKMELLKHKGEIFQIKPDLAVVADYGLIIPREIFDTPKYKTLNIHFSRLPQFRGPSPVQYAILTGQKSAWISIIIMDESMDAGDIIWQREVNPRENKKPQRHLGWCSELAEGLLRGGGIGELYENETTKSLYEKMFKIVAIELPNVISLYVQNKLPPQKQNHSKATYTKLFTKKDGFIPPQLLDRAIRGIKPTKKLLKSWLLTKNFQLYPRPELGSKATFNFQLSTERAIRALSPWPGVWTEITLRHLGGASLKHLGGGKLSLRSYVSPEVKRSELRVTKRLKILKAHLQLRTKNREPRTILVLDLVQLEGKKPVTWKKFQEGHPNFSFVN